MKRKLWLNFGALTALAALVAGCNTMLGHVENHHANSLYSYLYSGQSVEMNTDTIPVLSLPLRVGIAFVPPSQPREFNGYGYSGDNTLTEQQRMELMKQISSQFKSYPFVKSIDLIPTAYLTPNGGFANLEQIRNLYGVDVMVLLSYDQVQFTDEGLLSLSYWTIVGAYVVQGEKNDTQTMLDGAVFDIASHKLLFRAPGISTVKASATPINLSEELRDDSQQGFKEAATNLVTGMKAGLADFQDRVKSAPTEYKIVAKPGYTGGSAFGETGAMLVCGMGACYLWTRRNRRS